MHRRALVLLLCLIPCQLCEKSARESRNSHHLITQRDNIHARAQDTCVDQRGYITYVRMARFVLKIEKLSHIMSPRASQDLRSPSLIMAPVNTKIGGFVSLGVLFLTTWINSIINRLERTFWFEVGQRHPRGTSEAVGKFLNFRKFKVALNPLRRIFLNFAKSCILSC